jgi:hypothetical protein
MVAMVKSLSSSLNGDKTHVGCTKGVTIFGTPWRSVEAMNKDMAEEAYFEQATLKSPGDIRKHITSAKVELPASHLGLVRVFNNYVHLLEVMFGDVCDHLIYVRAIRDGLEEHETDLESRITQPICLHLMWRVHHNTRQFFLSCKGWNNGEALPWSQLGLTVQQLVEDCAFPRMMMCPVVAFLGMDPDAQTTPATDPTRTQTQAGTGVKPSINTANLPLCQKAVAALIQLYPRMTLMELFRQGVIKFLAVQVGRKGECSNFGLLDQCPGCTYAHVPCTVGEARQVDISKAMEQAMATMKAAAPKALQGGPTSGLGGRGPSPHTNATQELVRV